MGGTWEHYDKWNKLDKDIYHMILLTYGIKKQMKKKRTNKKEKRNAPLLYHGDYS